MLTEEDDGQEGAEHRHQLHGRAGRVRPHLPHAPVPKDVGEDRSEDRNVEQPEKALEARLDRTAGPELQRVERAQEDQGETDDGADQGERRQPFGPRLSSTE
jgi:hypothetical protein